MFLFTFSAAILEANELFKKKLKWKSHNPTSQRLVDKAWGLRDYKQPEIAEKFARGYDLLQEPPSENSDKSAETTKRSNRASSDINQWKSRPILKGTPSRLRESARSNRTTDLIERKKFFENSTKSSKRSEPSKQRPMSEPVRGML